MQVLYHPAYHYGSGVKVFGVFAAFRFGVRDLRLFQNSEGLLDVGRTREVVDSLL